MSRHTEVLGLADCRNCPLRGRTVVHGYSPGEEVDLVVVGEAPGSTETAKGYPFVGKAGDLLRHLLSRMDWDIARVHFTNVCLCQPPKNREPTAEEARCCDARLQAELDAVGAKHVLTLGNAAATSFLGTGKGITRRRGIVHEVDGRIILPTIHPAALLRDPSYWPDVQRDMERMRELIDGAPLSVDPPYENYGKVSPEELLHALEGVDLVALDVETTGLDPREDRLVTLGASWARGQGVVVEWSEMTPDHVRRLDALLRERRCSFHNAQFDLGFLNANGVHPRLWFDTMLAHYCLDERQGTHGLKRLAMDRYNAPDYEAETLGRSGFEDADVGKVEAIASRPREALYRYNCADTDYTFRLTEDLRLELERDDLLRVHDGILLPAVKHFVEFSRVGMRVDREYLESLGDAWRREMGEIEDLARTFPGAESLNLNSPKQVAEVLYDRLGLKPIPGSNPERLTQNEILDAISKIEGDDEAQEFWRTASSFTYRDLSARSTSAFVLYYLAQQHPLPRHLVRHRLLSKRYGSYYTGILKRLGSDGRLRPDYRLHGTVTGRLSSSNPNIHGIPRQETIRRIFVAEPGFVMVSADYAQAEIRMAASLSADPDLVNVLKSEDIHTEIAKVLYNMSDEDHEALGSDQRGARRRAAKTIAFGLIYGRSADSLATQLGVPRAEAETFIREFFRRMPRVREYIDRQHALVSKTYEVRSLYGRRRRFSLVADKRQAGEMKRQAVNMPIQSAVSDMTLLANIRTLDRLRDLGLETYPGPHIHDGFLFQVAESAEDVAVRVVTEAMQEDEERLRVPLAVEVKTGPSWGDLHLSEGLSRV